MLQGLKRALVCIIIGCVVVYAHIPILAVHGIGGTHHDFDDYAVIVRKNLPGARFFALEIFEGYVSVFTSMSWQLEMLATEINRLKSVYNFTDFNLICHSQGALLCRTYLMEYAHTCQTYVSLTGPQMGQFGATKPWEDFIPFLRNMSTHIAYKAFYTSEIQAFLSFSNYWNDPFHHLEFSKGCPFLRNYTYQVKPEYKQNFLKLKKAIFLGSRDDETIEPAESALFHFWNITNVQDDYKMIPMKDQRIYQQDLFGLKTLMESGRLIIREHPKVGHIDWLSREDLFILYVKDNLSS
jgi:palmitoyl-protein thioesterase